MTRRDDPRRVTAYYGSIPGWLDLMIASIAALLVLQLIGTIVVRLTGIPLPGPVVGMLLLFALLLWRGATPKPLETTTRGLLANLALLFVPAGVGIITHLREVAEQWLALSITIIASAAIAIVVTGFVLHWLMPATERDSRGV